ncbi:hypothetical protein HEQ62_01145 [Haematospirillum jordaniae]|nr:hypothetical protein [Haematospirillum jordaniae]NKD45813.1 hypothetical protein [Haematospirillum jordaniae]NKD56336.1 hypothetical protein [Haematospirillum jordaniae]NKD58394.1 hypothetical protein [Haematospirillum jordaniae]NKD66437.1 hypothetical protein [Haematospirillum jordaniae]NKD78396.1 hypothetical protein [Haematospirillum jordaniae]
MRTSFFSAGFFALSLLSESVFASSCLHKADDEAIRVRQLHVELMVAALKCGNSGAGLRDSYGRYVQAHSSTLSSNAHELRGYFKRSYGKNSTYHFDRFMTRLANDASIRSQGVVSYCQDAAKVLDAVNALETAESLKHFAVSSMPAQDDGLPQCKVSGQESRTASR